MAFDAHINFGLSVVSIPPAPALSGGSLTLVAGGGALMPSPPFNATVYPANTRPVKTNAEIVRVTAIVGDTLSIVRAQEGSIAMPIAHGYELANTMTVKTFTDIEAAINAIVVPVVSVFGRTGAVTAQNNDYTFAQIGSTPTTLGGYGITDAQPLDIQLSAIATLPDAAGWLHNDGAGVFAYSTPTKGDVGLGNVTNALQLVAASNLGDLTNVGTARGNLGGTTVGQNLFTLANPSAITFPRINANNTVSALDAASFRAAIGAGTSSFDGTWGSLSGKPVNVVSLGSLANSSGWLHNDGAGILAYSTPTKSDVGLGNVENTALSTWTGSINQVVIGSINSGNYGSIVTNRHYDAIVTVTSTISAALTSITDAGPFKRYMVYVPNGNYSDHIIPKSYVDIVGQSKSGVILNNSTDDSAIANTDSGAVAGNYMIANMTVTQILVGTGDHYAIHLDSAFPDPNRPYVGSVTSSPCETILYNIIATGYNRAGMGIGLYLNQRIYIIDSSSISTGGAQRGLFIHNQASQVSPCGAYLINVTASGSLDGFYFTCLGSGQPDTIVIIGGNFTTSSGSSFGLRFENSGAGAGEAFYYIDPTATGTLSITAGTRLTSQPIIPQPFVTDPNFPTYQGQTFISGKILATGTAQINRLGLGIAPDSTKPLLVGGDARVNGNLGINCDPVGSIAIGNPSVDVNLRTYTQSDQGIINFYQAQNYPTTNAFNRIMDIVAAGAGSPTAIRFMVQTTNIANPSEKMRLTKDGRLLLGSITAGASILNLDGLPRQTNNSGLLTGDVWCDTSSGNTLRVV
jgi:hypothetical protein